MEVLSGFNADSNPINVEFPPDSNQAPALQDYSATSSKNPSRISTLCIKYNIICEFESNNTYRKIKETTTDYYILDRLEKIRRGACGVTDENSDNSATNNDLGENAEIQYQHDSAESSVEGIKSNYLSLDNCCQYKKTKPQHDI